MELFKMILILFYLVWEMMIRLCEHNITSLWVLVFCFEENLKINEFCECNNKIYFLEWIRFIIDC